MTSTMTEVVAMVQAPEINLPDLLRFEPERGLIHLDDYRMLLLSACALGALRKELVETLGWERARGLMKRFGYAAGLADGMALAEMFPEVSGDRHMDFGPALHALEGFARIQRVADRSDIDLEHGRFHVEAYWERSFEAEQHLELFGESREPVCWTLTGYATGHSTSAAGRPTVVVETECLAMGHDRCRFVSTLAEEMPEAARREEKDYAPDHLPAVLQELLATIQRQKLTLRSSRETIQQLETQLSRGPGEPVLVGTSASFRKAQGMVEFVAPVSTTVLILGESGTGKELFARSIHTASPRAEGDFVAVNCSALPETLQEAELFGFAKGAFTGASRATPGLFEAAHRGTLFLDEIGDLSLSAQTKILRALQESEIKRLGETRVRRVDVRIVAATHQDLRRMIAEKTFREDLYYRLSVVTLDLPPLRERDNDALLLAEHFLTRFNRAFSKRLEGFSREAKFAILAYAWPGNVRELENAVERAVILARGSEIEVEDLPERVREAPADARRPSPEDGSRREADDAKRDRRDALRAIEDEAGRIRAALRHTGGNRARAARLLGIGRTTLWRRMKDLGL